MSDKTFGHVPREVLHNGEIYLIPNDLLPKREFCYGCVMPDRFCECNDKYEKELKELITKLKLTPITL